MMEMLLFAAKKFSEVQVMFPQSIWAPHSNLMAAYAYYSQDYYSEAISELRKIFKKISQSTVMLIMHII
jgi:outer membrane protein assembly factor BamD